MALDVLDLEDEDELANLPATLADSVLAVYLRQATTVAVAVRDGVWDDCLCLAAGMPEFAGGANSVQGNATLGETLLTTGMQMGIEIARRLAAAPPTEAVRMTKCWLCDTDCGSFGKGALDMIMGHVNHHHGGIAPVKCRHCSKVFHSYDGLHKGVHDEDCITIVRKSASYQREAACGIQGCTKTFCTYRMYA
jgi:hypothetical protein